MDYDHNVYVLEELSVHVKNPSSVYNVHMLDESGHRLATQGRLHFIRTSDPHGVNKYGVVNVETTESLHAWQTGLKMESGPSSMGKGKGLMDDN